ncbi:intermembrane transport protein PqiB [Marinomonas dokdonensis]|uniref:intermembrane transport protein PqiB n=1 Tax=Marinomonas dokdonensis TaxID=328224 RepID=UPI0040557302
MNLPKNNVESLRRVHFNTIWLVPLIAILVASWMLYQNWASQGPIITLVASNAEGLEAGQTTLKARNVDVGRVIDIRLSEDYDNAIIRVRMNHGTENMLREDAQFWVVKPRIGKEGVSGLGTLLSGAYINMSPGEEGDIKSEFTVLSQPPLSTENEGIRVVLHSKDASKLEVGALVHFRGYEVGYVEEVGFDAEQGAITYRVVIRSPYDALVNTAVQFWITPALAFKSTAKGFEVSLDSLETFLSGGITFGLAEDRPAGQAVTDLQEFRLFASKTDADNNRFDDYIEYVFLFDANLTSLLPGAPVEFRGIRIGTVMEVPFTGISMSKLAQFEEPLIPVMARIEPQRLGTQSADDMSLQEWNALFDERIEKGLRASIIIGNYLNAAKLISLDFMDDAPPPRFKEFEGHRIFPTGPDFFGNIEGKISGMLENFAEAPIQETFASLNQTMGEASKTLAQLQALSNSVQSLVEQTKDEELPAEVAKTLQEVNNTLASYQANGQIGGPLRSNMQALERALNELQPLLRQLREQPNTLIFDAKPRTDLEPKAAR